MNKEQNILCLASKPTTAYSAITFCGPRYKVVLIVTLVRQLRRNSIAIQMLLAVSSHQIRKPRHLLLTLSADSHLQIFTKHPDEDFSAVFWRVGADGDH